MQLKTKNNFYFKLLKNLLVLMFSSCKSIMLLILFIKITTFYYISIKITLILLINNILHGCLNFII